MVYMYSDFCGMDRGNIRIWKIHPFREGNTRTVVTYCCQFIENRGFYIDSELFKDNAQYLRTALVAASAIFHDLGDRHKMEYVETIVEDALSRGEVMREAVEDKIIRAGYPVTEDTVRRIVFWNRKEKCNPSSIDIQRYLS